MLRPTLIALAILVVPGGRALAQDLLTLDEAIARTLATNAALRASRAAQDEARARTGEARAGYLPRVDVAESWTRSDHPVFVFSSLLAQHRFTAADFALEALNRPDPLSNHRLALAVQQTVFDGHRTRAAVSAARIGEAIARLDADLTVSDLRFAVTSAFGRVLASAALLGSARAATASAAEDLRRAEARRDAGLENEANVLGLRVHGADVEARRIRAESDEAVVRARLNALMGAPLDENRPLAEPHAPGAEPDPTALEQLALQQRPELRRASLRHEEVLASQMAARAAFLPQLVAQGGAEANGRVFGQRGISWTAGLQVRWNIFNGGGDAARRRKAAAAVARAAAQRDQVETDIRVEVRTAIAEHRAALARRAVARLMADQADESRRILRDRYEAGLAPAADLLRASEAVIQADATRISAAVDVLVTAAAIERALGLGGMTP